MPYIGFLGFVVVFTQRTIKTGILFHQQKGSEFLPPTEQLSGLTISSPYLVTTRITNDNIQVYGTLFRKARDLMIGLCGGPETMGDNKNNDNDNPLDKLLFSIKTCICRNVSVL